MIKAKRRQNEWIERIRDYRASGLTMAAWCETQGLNLHQLKYWLRKIDSSPPCSSSPSSLTLRIGPASLDVQAGFSPEISLMDGRMRPGKT